MIALLAFLVAVLLGCIGALRAELGHDARRRTLHLRATRDARRSPRASAQPCPYCAARPRVIHPPAPMGRGIYPN